MIIDMGGGAWLRGRSYGGILRSCQTKAICILWFKLEETLRPKSKHPTNLSEMKRDWMTPSRRVSSEVIFKSTKRLLRSPMG